MVRTWQSVTESPCVNRVNVTNLFMKGFVTNIEKDALENTDFRRVLYTAQHCQLVIMSLLPKEEIGEEIHHLDQFIRCESGLGKAVLNGIEHTLTDGFIIVVPSGAKHNIINVSEDKPLKLYTLYAPANHRDGVVHKTKAEADADEDEHFNGKTTE